jgi:hypothetical protein
MLGDRLFESYYRESLYRKSLRRKSLRRKSLCLGGLDSPGPESRYRNWSLYGMEFEISIRKIS